MSAPPACLSAIETTFGNNSAYGYQDAVGGAIDTAGALSLEHVTIADNSVSGIERGGGRRLRHRLEPAEPLHARRQPDPALHGPGQRPDRGQFRRRGFRLRGELRGQINDALIGTSANIRTSVIFQTIGDARSSRA